MPETFKGFIRRCQQQFVPVWVANHSVANEELSKDQPPAYFNGCLRSCHDVDSPKLLQHAINKRLIQLQQFHQSKAAFAVLFA
jgi:hypothetical protein